MDFVEENWIALATLTVMLFGADLKKSMANNWMLWLGVAAVGYFLWQRQHATPLNLISAAQGATTTSGGSSVRSSKPGTRGEK